MKNLLTTLSVLLVVCLLLPVAVAEDTSHCLCDVLRQEMAEATDPAAVFAVAGYLSLTGQMQQELIRQTHDRAREEIDRLLGEAYHYAALAQVDGNAFVETAREQAAQGYAGNLVKELLGEGAAILTASLDAGFEILQFEGQFTKEQIEKLAASSQILSVAKPDCFDCSPPFSPAEYAVIMELGVFTWSGNTVTYTYSAADALNILKNVVGKTYTQPAGVPSWVYDVNEDGEATADDALMALQSAVGNITVAFPQAYLAG